MKIIGLMTEDFRFFYETVRALKRREEPFVSLGFDDVVPQAVGVIITTPEERERVGFPRVVARRESEEAIDLANCMLRGGQHFEKVIVGIDPGIRIGTVIMGDGRTLLARVYSSPEGLSDSLTRLVRSLEPRELVIRVGHGDRTRRDRIIRRLWPLGAEIEVVDETSTTRRTEHPDIDAAIAIALSQGTSVRSPPIIEPTPGEIRDIKRLSRIESKGRMTIDSELAGRVARGEISLSEAVQLQDEKVRLSSHRRAA